MKKRICLFLSLILALLAAGTALGETLLSEKIINETIIPSEGTAYYAYQYVYFDGAAWVLMQNGALYRQGIGESAAARVGSAPVIRLELLQTAYDQLSAEEKAEMGEGVTTLISGKDALYALNAYSGKIGRFENGEFSWLPSTMDISYLYGRRMAQDAVQYMERRQNAVLFNALSRGGKGPAF